MSYSGLLFSGIFNNSKVADGFKLGRSKASYIFLDGLGPLGPCLAMRLCNDVSSSTAFTLLFKETIDTTLQSC